MTTSAAAVAEATTFSYQLIPVAKIQPSPLNPRKHFDQTKLEELAATMGNGVGIIEPLVVRPFDIGRQINRDAGKAARSEFAPFEIVAGERRWRAAQLAGLAEAPAVVKNLTDAQVLEIMVIENDQREDINPLEEGDGFKRLMKFGFDIDKLAARIGRSRKYIYDRVKLLDLIKPAQKLLLDGRMSAGHAILIARLTADQQENVIEVDEYGTSYERHQPLFVSDHSLLTAADDQLEEQARKKDPYVGMKTKSVRELEAWIAEHCRFDPAAPVNTELFPETVAAVEEAKKVISITHSHYVQPDAKDGNSQRIYGPKSWKRADGKEKSKTCTRSVTGVVVVGPCRGEAHEVCVHKECDTHWGAEKRARERSTSPAAHAKQKKQEETWQEQQKREEAERQKREKAWKAASPDILKAVTAKVLSVSIATIVGDQVSREDAKFVKQAMALLELKPTGPEEGFRILLMADLLGTAEHLYRRDRFIAKARQLLGVDVAAILKASAKAQTSAPEAKPAAKKKPAPKAKAAKKR